MWYIVQCQSADDNEYDDDDDDGVFNDCDEQMPVVRLIPQSYMTRPPNNTAAFPSDTAAQPPTSTDGKCCPTKLQFRSAVRGSTISATTMTAKDIGCGLHT